MSRLIVNPAHPYPDTMRVRKAAKDHKCEGLITRDGVRVNRWNGKPQLGEHRETIYRGGQYVEEFGEAAPFQAGHRYCIACALAAGFVIWGAD